jgi:2-hydroxy-3-keto-5-methylthiopentenyl-1-phosphate phosphatase
MRTSSDFPTPDSRATPTPVIFSDFDGTIAQLDVTDVILESFADPAWHEVEDEWVQGRIGSRECLRRQMALVHASVEDLDSLIDSIPLDPGFADFHRWTRQCGIPFYVVSDGFDYVIQRVLRSCGVNGDLLNGSHLFSSSMRVDGSSLVVDFPHWPESCEHGCATCKPEVIRRVRGSHSPVIFIGDGLSDRFSVTEADVVFAKDKLLAHCVEHSLHCRPFSEFSEIRRELDAMVTGAVPHKESNGGRDARAPRGGRPPDSMIVQDRNESNAVVSKAQHVITRRQV